MTNRASIHAYPCCLQGDYLSNAVINALALPTNASVVLQGTRLINTLHEPIPAEAAHIKTMVLVRDDVGSAGLQLAPACKAAAAPAAAVCVLLLAGHKVDLRAVAQHMQLPRGSFRLATADEAVSSTGYELGCIPPLGEGSSSAMAGQNGWPLSQVSELCSSYRLIGRFGQK